MTELEHRQDVLLKKLDVLYERIKTISSICTFSDKQASTKAGVQSVSTFLQPKIPNAIKLA